MSLALGSQSHRVRAVGDPSLRCALASRVYELSTEHPQREVLSDDAVVGEMARSEGIEPSTFRLLTPAALPLSVRTLDCVQDPSEGRGDRPPGSLAVPLSPGGASEAVKLVRACSEAKGAPGLCQAPAGKIVSARPDVPRVKRYDSPCRGHESEHCPQAPRSMDTR